MLSTMIQVVMYLTCRERDTLLSMHITHYYSSGHVLTYRELDTLLSMHITHYDTSGHVFNVQGA
jgi:hypothetical protein